MKPKLYSYRSRFNYFVSMTDMMVGVLFIFLIMLMVFALDFQTKSDAQDVALDVARQAAEKVKALQHEVHSGLRGPRWSMIDPINGPVRSTASPAVPSGYPH